MSNYYLALGINKDADIDKIKKAYRFYCKQYHPDTATSKSKQEKFQRIQEAYETLSDQEKREAYDRSMGPPIDSPSTQTRQPPTPTNETFFRKKRKQDSFIRRFSASIDEFFDGFVSGIFEDDFSGKKELFLELILSPHEAQWGGDFPIEIPVLDSCDFCNGNGHMGRFLCNHCNGRGHVSHQRSILLHVPAHISSGSEAKIGLEGIGLPEVNLNVEIIVSSNAW